MKYDSLNSSSIDLQAPFDSTFDWRSPISRRRAFICLLILLFVLRFPLSDCHAQVSSPLVTQVAKLLPSDGNATGYFGFTASLDGSLALVGSEGHWHNGIEDSGGAYLYQVTNQGQWEQVAHLLPNDPAKKDYFATNVSLDGTKALIGSDWDDDFGDESGSAYLFADDGSGNWNQVAKIHADDASEGDHFGWDVALDGSVAIVSAYQQSNDEGTGQRGAAYIFEEDPNGNWQQTAKLIPDDPVEPTWFGRQVALDGDTALVGSIFDKAYVFQNDGNGNWNQKAILTDSNLNDDRSFFGERLDLSGNRIIVGAYSDDIPENNIGTAYILEEDGSGDWQQVAQLYASDGESLDWFGTSVAINGDLAVVGAIRKSGGGRAYVFSRNNSGNWIEIATFTADDTAGGDNFGSAADLDGRTLLIGAWLNDDAGTSSGSAYIFEIVPEPSALVLLFSVLPVAVRCRHGLRQCLPC